MNAPSMEKPKALFCRIISEGQFGVAFSLMASRLSVPIARQPLH
jgi:hypothetical protein